MIGYILKNEYSARATDPRRYHAVTKDIIARWSYPIAPDAQLLHFNDSNYKHVRRSVYFDDTVKVMRSSEVNETLIGKNSIIANSVKIERSTVGNNCRIDSNVKIIDSHIWDNVIIEDGAIINGAIICSNAIIKKNAKLSKGSIISFGVTVNENEIIPEFTRLHIPSVRDQTSKSSSQAVVWKNNDVPNDGEDDDDDDLTNLITLMKSQSIGSTHEIMHKICRWEQSLPVTDNDDDDDDVESREDYDRDDQYDITMSDYDNKSNKNSVNIFSETIADMVFSGYQDNHPGENINMEIKSFKFSQNKSFPDCLRGIVPSLLRVCVASNKTKKALISFSKVFFSESNFGYIILKPFIQNINDE